jgi:hypothetical protein
MANSDQELRIRLHINAKLLEAIEKLDTILSGDKEIKDRHHFQSLYTCLCQQKNLIQKHHKRYGCSGYQLYLNERQNEVLQTLNLMTIRRI